MCVLPEFATGGHRISLSLRSGTISPILPYTHAVPSKRVLNPTDGVRVGFTHNLKKHARRNLSTQLPACVFSTQSDPTSRIQCTSHTAVLSKPALAHTASARREISRRASSDTSHGLRGRAAGAHRREQAAHVRDRPGPGTATDAAAIMHANFGSRCSDTPGSLSMRQWPILGAALCPEWQYASNKTICCSAIAALSIDPMRT